MKLLGNIVFFLLVQQTAWVFLKAQAESRNPKKALVIGPLGDSKQFPGAVVWFMSHI